MNKRQHGIGAVFTRAFREREALAEAEANRKLCHEVLCAISAAVTMVMLVEVQRWTLEHGAMWHNSGARFKQGPLFVALGVPPARRG